MTRTIRDSHCLIAGLVAITLVMTIGCRQFGRRSSEGSPAPITPSAPSFSSPPESSGPSLPDIPPPPPAAASTFNPADYGPPRRLGWSRPRSAPQSPKVESFVVTESLIAGREETSPTIETTSGKNEEVAVILEDLASLVPPSASVADEDVVPPPRDLEDDERGLQTTPRLRAVEKVVQIDMTEFLAELDQMPAPARTTVSTEPVTLPAISLLSVPSPSLTDTASPRTIPAWPPNGVEHGIAVNPGPVGTGNRLDTYPRPLLLWNAGNVSGAPLPHHGTALNSWAGQNSDWDGRQFR